jgi:hypothetical protein
MDPDHLKLALTCRRLFLRNWRLPAVDGSFSRVEVSVNVTIFVRYEDSDSKGDDFSKVVDYNVMRDALLRAGDPHGPTFVDQALQELLAAPIVLAIIEMRDHLAHKATIVCRGADRARISERKSNAEQMQECANFGPA